MITPYYGEILFYPVPLELSPAPCGYGCAYCFVRHNGTVIRPSSRAIGNLVAERSSRKSIQARLLDEGYPVLLSNRTDPFCPAVWPMARYAVQVLADAGNRCCFQTKGGSMGKIRELLDIMGYKACFYVTMTSDIPEVTARIEPGAPPVEERLAMAEYLVARGHVVQVGINPCVRSWFRDIGGFMARLAKIGVHGVWVEPLHLNTNRLRRKNQAKAPGMTRADGEAIGPEACAEGSSRYLSDEGYDFIRLIDRLAIDKGMQFYGSHSYLPSDYFEPYRRLYGKTFPVTQDAINRLHVLERERVKEDARNGTAQKGYSTVSFDDFWELLTEDARFPGGTWNLRDYVAALDKSVTFSGPLQMRDSSFKSLIRLFWSDRRFKMSPCRNEALAMAVDDENALIVDEGGLPFYLFNPDGDMPEFLDIDGEL
jgi:DNA repair photolyase